MISEMDMEEPTAGFEDPVLGPQKTFRAILEAMAHPGMPVKINSNLCFPERLNNDKILSGPGIKNGTPFSPAGIHSQFWEQWQLQAALFPLGVDVFFTCNNLLAALPRTIQVSDPIGSDRSNIKKGDSDSNRPVTDRNVCA
jgi:alpha-D-ribose 1-methylphosphonate 5-triphosphate synthase subunit PhnH